MVVLRDGISICFIHSLGSSYGYRMHLIFSAFYLRNPFLSPENLTLTTELSGISVTAIQYSYGALDGSARMSESMSKCLGYEKSVGDCIVT